ncbi:MAG: MerR family transcriptional regulator [Desulfobacterales bacterium]|jgi:DNA-binding transcriptional MerR regulator|nr:MerR family transcriptional regulator [Desulfobacteraceae bacterium]MBT4364665.1 MerR family transcriptional regulator [Desulfobacteraceae bacterium]MBT7086125.1 MerR family transcriptional regulator [Desulfobacterales bacterium]MBT7698438.1 MerR family transcriptional regulator [Desulfobacterales bacterium]
MKNINESKDIPDKSYFKIGEVVSITGVESYVLRFWESEFKTINPKRTGSGQRLYRRCDVELILKIKNLLYEKKFTIQGAKQNLSNKNKKKQAELQINTIDEIRSELLVIRNLLA